MANKVKRLCLFNFDTHHDRINLSPIISILPNVQTLTTSSDPSRNFEMDQETELSFYNRIQVIHERPNSIIHSALSSHLCPQLTRLRVDHIENNVIHYLKNAPNLTYLDISSSANNFGALTTVHNYAPHIQYMRLDFLYSYMEITSLETTDLTPASSVTECVFENISTNDSTTLANLLTFVGIKYPNLTKLAFHIAYDESRFFEVAVHDVSFDSSYDGVPSNMTSLCFRAVQVRNGADTFLSRFFPRLIHLTLDGCDMVQRIFNLADIDLISFGFSSSFERRYWCRKIMVETLDNEENRLYNLGNYNYKTNVDDHLRSLCQPFESRLITNMDSEFGFKLICNSLKNIDFH